MDRSAASPESPDPRPPAGGRRRRAARGAAAGGAATSVLSLSLSLLGSGLATVLPTTRHPHGPACVDRALCPHDDVVRVCGCVCVSRRRRVGGPDAFPILRHRSLYEWLYLLCRACRLPGSVPPPIGITHDIYTGSSASRALQTCDSATKYTARPAHSRLRRLDWNRVILIPLPSRCTSRMLSSFSLSSRLIASSSSPDVHLGWGQG